MTRDEIKNEVRFYLRQADMEELPERLRPEPEFLARAGVSEQALHEIYREVVAELEPGS